MAWKRISLCALFAALLISLGGCLWKDDRRGGTAAPVDVPVSADPGTAQAVTPVFPSSVASYTSPLRIAWTASGWLLVSDPGLGAVLRVNATTLLSDGVLPVSGKPLAVGMHGGEIFVGLANEGAIRIYDQNGVAAGYLVEPGGIGHPSDLAIAQGSGLVFALDGLAREVKVYVAGDRSLLGTIGTDQLEAPTGVAVDPARQEVLVSDYGSSSTGASVRIFSYAGATFGNLTGAISGGGGCGAMTTECAGGFSRPRGLAVAGSRIYVSDVIRGQVLVFDRASQQEVGAFGSGDPALGDLRIPSDVAFNAAGDLFVTSSMTRSVVAFRGVAP